MKSILYVCAVVALFASCNSEEIQSQRCKGILLDSLTSLSKFRDRVVCLETGACGMLKDYQARIDSLENEIDSLHKVGSRYQRLYRTKASARMMRNAKHVAATKKETHSMTYPMEAKATPATTPAADTKDPFYYDQNLQKYFFYDRVHKVYYSFDPVSRKKIYQ
jgi:hypothetical protein